MPRPFRIATALSAFIAMAGQAAPPATTARQLVLIDKPAPSPTTSVPPEASRDAYLLVYFKDETHGLYFATSRDGYSFTDVNGGNPVLPGRAIAAQQGIRDPHIMRGPDGAFYLTMTDLHIFAQREGLRTTQWERPEADYGWGNNRNLILMKSTDLIHWTHARVDIAKLFPAYRQAGSAWAPETIWDPETRRMMVYFTTRIAAGPNFMVYSYADPAFRTLTAAPKKIFDYPNPKVNVIDADITRVDDRYHMFYVAHEKPGNIRQAVSTEINRGYVYDPRKVDPETKASEAPTLWRRHGTDKWVLMYDVFGVTPNNMGFSETTDFVTFRDLGHFNAPGSPMKATNFTAPKHAAVMAITAEEATRLERRFATPAADGRASIETKIVVSHIDHYEC